MSVDQEVDMIKNMNNPLLQKEDEAMVAKMKAMAEQDLTMIERGEYRIPKDLDIRGSITYWSEMADKLGPNPDYAEAAMLASEILEDLIKKKRLNEEKIKEFARMFNKVKE